MYKIQTERSYLFDVNGMFAASVSISGLATKMRLVVPNAVDAEFAPEEESAEFASEEGDAEFTPEETVYLSMDEGVTISASGEHEDTEDGDAVDSRSEHDDAEDGDAVDSRSEYEDAEDGDAVDSCSEYEDAEDCDASEQEEEYEEVSVQQQLEEAFQKVIAAFEVTNMKIEMNAWGDAFYVNYDEPHGNSISFTEKSLSQIITEQEKIRFRLEEGEFLRLFACVNENDVTLHFLMHQMAGDSKTLCCFAEAFIRALNEETLDFRKLEGLHEETFPKDSQLFIGAKLYAKYMNYHWKQRRLSFGLEDLKNAFETYWKNHETEVRSYDLSGEAYQNRLMECKNTNIDFAPYMIAELLKDMKGTQQIELLLDGRVQPGASTGCLSTGCLSTGITIRFKYNKNVPVIENARLLHMQIQKKLEKNSTKYFIRRFMNALDPALVDAINMETAGTFRSKISLKLANLLGLGKKKRDLCMVDLGKLDFPTQIGQYKIEDLVVIPPALSCGKNVVAMVTRNDKVNVAMHRQL